MAEKWIDVSAHQGAINWPKVSASGVRGAIIRAGYGNDASQRDTCFTANMKGAIAAGLKVAVYWFGYADSPTDARKEWAVCKQIIAPYKGHILFVAYDYEYDSISYYRRVHGTAPSNALINSMVNTFLCAAKADGYGTMLYTNNDYRLNTFSAETLAAWDVWIADYTGDPDIACAIQQTGSTGRADGISGNVDIDTCFKAYGKSAADPPYTCDTSGTVEVARGAAYQVEITCASAPRIGAGTADVVTILPRSSGGGKWYYYLVPIGKRGDEAGIYINGGPRQLIVKIK